MSDTHICIRLSKLAFALKNQGTAFAAMRLVPQKHHMDGIIFCPVVNAMRILAVQSLLTVSRAVGCEHD